MSIALGPIGRTQRLATAGTSPDSRALLSTAQIEVHEAREVARRIRTLDDAYWRGRFESMPGRSRVTGLIDPDTFRRAAPEEWAVGSYAEWPVAGDEEARIATFIELGAAHLQVANAITSAFSAIAEITQSCGAVPGSSEGPGVGSQASSFAQAILDEALGLLAAGDDQRVVQRQLLRVHVAQTLLLGDVETREQRIDLMQLSWNTYNGLAPERAPNDKLAGPELARLGAFLKHSWRANDWLWGRMDGAHRLVVLLLDPGRLAQVHASAAAARAAIEQATGVAIPDDAARELDYIDAGIDRAALAAAARRSAGHRGADRHRARGAAHRHRGGPHVEGTWGQHRRECRLRGVGTEGGRSRRPRRHLRWAGGRHRQGDAHRSRDRRCGARLFADEPNPEPGCLRRRQRPHRFRGRAALRRWRPASPATPAARRQQPRVGDDQRLSRLARGATAFILAVAGTIVALRVVGIAVPTGTFAVAAVLFIGAVVVAMLRSGFALMGTAVGGIALVIALTLTGPDLAEVVYSGEHATTDGELPAGTGIELDGPGVVRVTQGDGSAERISDIEVDGAVVVLRDAGGVIRGEPATDHVAGWKRWGFLEAWRGWCWWWSPWSSSPGPRRGASPWLVDMATGLHGYGLEIVLLLLVGVAVAISLGADLVVRRWSKVRRG
ncbi:MAG: DUF3376 domain-containing protein [Acidimicrobiia bacterium]|nr:DUF3376 domain-containing protein [Acidimicrobiia bacterium]